MFGKNRLPPRSTKRRLSLGEVLESKQMMAGDAGVALTTSFDDAGGSETVYVARAELQSADGAITDGSETQQADKSTPKLCESILTGKVH